MENNKEKITPEETLKFLKLFREYWDVNSSTKNAAALDSAIEIVEKSIPKKNWTVTGKFIIPKEDNPTKEEVLEGLRYGLNELFNNWGISTVIYDDMEER